MARIALVTGAHGFIWRHVAKHLASTGVTVIAMGHGNWLRSDWRHWGVSDWHVADISLESLMTYGGEPNLIFHCAGSGSVAYSITNPYQDFQRSVSTTLAILEYARLHVPSAKIVIPSSAAVYGYARKFPTLEGDPIAPMSPYGVHKVLSEQICRSYCSQFGLSAAIVRLFSVYGISLRKQLLWDACTKMKRDEACFAGTGNESRDWIYVEDAAELIVTASQYATSACTIANGGSGQCATVREILGCIAQVLRPSGVPIFSGDQRPGDPSRQVADISVARSWGWAPKVHWSSGVRQYAEWFKAGSV